MPNERRLGEPGGPGTIEVQVERVERVTLFYRVTNAPPDQPPPSDPKGRWDKARTIIAALAFVATAIGVWIAWLNQ